LSATPEQNAAAPADKLKHAQDELALTTDRKAASSHVESLENEPLAQGHGIA
jgi:hypothetical protein